VAENDYFKKTRVKVDWQFMLVVGIILGALISSATDKSFKNRKRSSNMGGTIRIIHWKTRHGGHSWAELSQWWVHVWPMVAPADTV